MELWNEFGFETVDKLNQKMRICFYCTKYSRRFLIYSLIASKSTSFFVHDSTKSDRSMLHVSSCQSKLEEGTQEKKRQSKAV
jgi:hypothetical protein